MPSYLVFVLERFVGEVLVVALDPLKAWEVGLSWSLVICAVVL